MGAAVLDGTGTREVGVDIAMAEREERVVPAVAAAGVEAAPSTVKVSGVIFSFTILVRDLPLLLLLLLRLLLLLPLRLLRLLSLPLLLLPKDRDPDLDKDLLRRVAGR